MDKTINIIETDVLVIGGGLAGCWAAIRAKEITDNVLLVDKSRIGKSGMSYFAAGVLVYWTPEDSIDPWMREIAEGGAYLNDQKWLEVVLRENYPRINEMDEWSGGRLFEKDAGGRIERIKGRGHQDTRIVMFHGPELMDVMRKQIRKRKIRAMDRIMITDLLTLDGYLPTKGFVTGAVGLHTRTGDCVVIKAKATVLANGGADSKPGGHYCMNITGDSYAMAYRAGAEMTGMEFMPMGNLSVWNRKYHTVGINMIQSYGMKLINNRSEPFLEKYEPVLKDRSHLYTLAQAMAKEALEGRGPIYADMRSFTPAVIEKFKRVIPKFMRIFEDAGIDITKELVEVTPGIRMKNSICTSGARILDLTARSSIAGLYCAGAASKAPSHGGDEGVGGFNLPYCNVSGYRAGENAALYAKEMIRKVTDINMDQVDTLRGSMYAPLYRKEGMMPDEIFEKLNKIYIPAKFSIFKNAERIRSVLDEVRQVEEIDLPRLKAPDAHELVKALEAVNLVTTAKLAYSASLSREESRTYHYREDFPYRDDIHWLKWVIIKRGENSEMEISTKNVPLEDYPVKPDKMKVTRAAIQMNIQEGI
ncbi:MAG: FAD-dependent oxidoreductase [Deltaproteobacteria bacterium]|nr:FAD-dependent oxidoreductase [Deltaproteobacteria bacterium]